MDNYIARINDTRFTSFAFAEDIFTTKEAAEARLKELQEKQL